MNQLLLTDRGLRNNEIISLKGNPVFHEVLLGNEGNPLAIELLNETSARIKVGENSFMIKVSSGAYMVIR